MYQNIHKTNVFRFSPLFLISIVLVFTSGCGGKKQTAGEKSYGKPQWYQVDKSKFVKLSEDETAPPEGGGKITIFDPIGWDRKPAGKAPTGFNAVIRFQKGSNMIMMTKSKAAKDLDDLDKENIEEFADSAQHLFKTKVEMVELGNIVGVMFRKAGRASQSVSGKKLERRIVATSIGGELYTYELVADAGKITSAMLYTLFSVIANTKIEGMANYTEIAAVEKKEEPQKTEEVKPEPKPEPKEEVKPVEVAAAPAAEKKPEETPKPATAPPKKKKGNTQNILNELDALLK
ncbi:MAG: hypothetical protein FWE67_08935 [Planctomycetaceae bacterium]|nr:hypothetical protein [Planctomycetaceae bacterium]